MEELDRMIGKHFVKERHGERQIVVLEDVRRDKVKIREVDRDNSSVIPTAKFQKFYSLRRSA